MPGRNHTEGSRETPVLYGLDRGRARGPYEPIRMRTSRGLVESRYYGVIGSPFGVVWLGGELGGWASPAGNLYDRLCLALTQEGIAGLHVRLREPRDHEESIHDALAGVAFLEAEGMAQLGLVGYSSGGAVALDVAARALDSVRTLITLASTETALRSAPLIAGKCSWLLIHGKADAEVPPQASQELYHLAGQPKLILLYDGATHSLEEVERELVEAICHWLVTRLLGRSALATG